MPKVATLVTDATLEALLRLARERGLSLSSLVADLVEDGIAGRATSGPLDPGDGLGPYADPGPRGPDGWPCTSVPDPDAGVPDGHEPGRCRCLPCRREWLCAVGPDPVRFPEAAARWKEMLPGTRPSPQLRLVELGPSDARWLPPRLRAEWVGQTGRPDPGEPPA